MSVSLCGTRPASCENHVGGRGLIMSFVCVIVWYTPGQLRESSAGGGRGLIMSSVCVSVWHTPGQLREPSAGGGRGLIMSSVCVSVWHTPGQLREPSAGGGRGRSEAGDVALDGVYARGAGQQVLLRRLRHRPGVDPHGRPLCGRRVGLV